MLEVRRAEGGIRAWDAAPGEAYHQLDGAYGGLWRRLGRPPQALAGVGFSSQGLFEGSHYRLLPAAADPAVAWIFEGVDDETIGDFGLSGGGAAGFELDRADRRLGTPPNTVILARSEGHQAHFVAVPEELLSHVNTVTGEAPRDLIRAEIVYFETDRRRRGVRHRLHHLLRQPVARRLSKQRLAHAGQRASRVSRPVGSGAAPCHGSSSAASTLPDTAVRGDGIRLHLASGQTVIDGSGGAAVACIGHGNQRVAAAMAEQAGRMAYAHTGFFTSEPAEALADILLEDEPGGLTHAFFVSSGSEAMEAAIKLARQYFIEIGRARPHPLHRPAPVLPRHHARRALLPAATSPAARPTSRC